MKSISRTCCSEGMLIVKALRATMFPCEDVASRNETAMHGGREQQMPVQAAVMTLGLPSES